MHALSILSMCIEFHIQIFFMPKLLVDTALLLRKRSDENAHSI